MRGDDVKRGGAAGWDRCDQVADIAKRIAN
jgi:hypothetical protein